MDGSEALREASSLIHVDVTNQEPPRLDVAGLAREGDFIVSEQVDPNLTITFEKPLTVIAIAVATPEGYRGDRVCAYWAHDLEEPLTEAMSRRIAVREDSARMVLAFDRPIQVLRLDPTENPGATGISLIDVLGTRDVAIAEAHLDAIPEATAPMARVMISDAPDQGQGGLSGVYGAHAIRSEVGARRHLRRPRVGSVEMVFDPEPNLVDPDWMILARDTRRIAAELFGVQPKVVTSSLGDLNRADLSLCICQTALSWTMVDSQWELPVDIRDLRRLCFMSAGSAVIGRPGEHGYRPTRYTRRLLELLFSGPWLHGVRDAFTADLLEDAGVSNFVVVGTPSLWDIGDGLGATIPRGKGGRAVFAADETFHDRVNDAITVRVLAQCYDSVAIWPLAPNGPELYARELAERSGAEDKVEVLEFGPHSLDLYLAEPGTDYVGPNLEVGIRALKAHRRSLFLSVDDRSIGVIKLAHLPSIRRIEVSDILAECLLADFETRPVIPRKAIRAWLSQFK